LARLRVLSGSEVCLVLAARGFTEVKQRGRHFVMQKRQGATTITVTVPNYSELRISTLQSAIRQSGLKRKLFEIS